MEARSFYTYYLRTLSGITRGSYKLNTTITVSNETNVSQPKHADGSDLSLHHSGAMGGQGSCKEEVSWPWVVNRVEVGLCLSPGEREKKLWLGYWGTD